MEPFAGPVFEISDQGGLPAIAALEDGKFVVSYSGFSDVSARVLNPSGTRASGEIDVDRGDDLVRSSNVAGLAGGGFVVSWSGERTPAGSARGNDYDPLFHIFDETAGSVSGVKGAAGPDGQNDFQTRVTAFGDGFAMVWTADGDEGTDGIDDGIAGRFFSAIGTPRANPEWINVERADVQRDASAATLDDGTMVFAYQSWDGNDVLVRTYGDNAEPFGEERSAATTTEGNQHNPEVAKLAEDDRFVVIWDHNSSDDSQDGIRAQIFETSGSGPGRDFAPVGAEIIVTLGRDAGERLPHVAGIGGGGFVALWLENTGETTDFGGRIRAIKAQFYDATGRPTGEELQLFEGYFGTVVSFDVAENELGALMAVWTAYQETSDGALDGSIFGRVLNVPVTAEEVEGTPAADVLNGTDGNDTILGLAENDRLVGNSGNDSLDGGPGADTLNGGDGDDTILGGPDDDDLRDVVFGGPGNDSVIAGAGNDLVYGQDGHDTIAGGAGVDELQGQDGNDVITGSAFSDLVFGGAGDDFVNGGFGHDRINGGSGADKFFHVGVEGHGSDWVQDFVAADSDILLWGGAPASGDDFQVNLAHTANAAGERSGDDAVQEAFVIYKPTGQIIWALVDGGGQDEINIQIGGDTFDLFS